MLGQVRDPLAPLRDAINDEGDIVVPVDPRYLGFWLTRLFGEPTTAAVKATGTITFAVNPSDGDTITLGGAVWTFVAGAPADNETQIQGTATQTVDQLVTDLNGSADVEVSKCTYARPASTQQLAIEYDVAGTGGNGFSIAASAATVSGSTLAGGGYEHVFASGADDLPSYTLEVGHPPTSCTPTSR